MADFSLDDYIRKAPNIRGVTKGNKGQAGKKFVKQPITIAVPNKKFTINRQYGQQQQQQQQPQRPYGRQQQRQNTNIKGRLGQQQKPNPSFRVTGVGNANVQDARQKLSQRKVTDAREKILAKTKFVDARVRIENKKAQHQQKQQQQQPQLQQQLQTQQPRLTDARARIQSAQAKKQDARQKIQARQGQRAEGRGQVVVTNQGRVMSHMSHAGVVASGSNLLKVVKNNTLAMDNVHVPQNGSSQALNFFETQENGVITISRPDQYQQPVSSQPSHIPPHMMEGGAIIQIRNDMYQAPVPQPRPVYHQPQMTYQQPQQDSFYPEQEPVYHHPQLMYEQQPVVRVAPPPQPRRTAKTPVKTKTLKTRVTKPASAPQRVSRVSAMEIEDDMELPENPSPIQGYKVMVTNLHPVVTQEDVVELFGAMGALKKARLVKVGTAEVVFVQKNDALTAVRKYHLRELDGRPMNVILISSQTAPKGEAAVMKRLAPAAPPPAAPAPVARAPAPTPVKRTPITAPGSTPEAHQPLRLGKMASSTTSSGSSSLDANVLHKALFKTVSQNEPPSTPVTFTVKI